MIDEPVRDVAPMEVDEEEKQPIAPPPPDVNTGLCLADLRRNMKVLVWWLDDWWAAKITHLNVIAKRVSVRFLGDDYSTPGIYPHHIKIA